MRKTLLKLSLFFLFSGSIFAQVNNQSDSATINLKEIEVNALRADANTPMAISNLDKGDISKTNFAQDLPYLLQNTPSLVATSDGGTGVGYTGLRIRGTDATRINVTINGIPMNDAESHGVYWVDMPDIASSVESIQIQRGVGTSTNGAGAFGGTINMNTDKVNKNYYGEVNTSYGSFNTSKIVLRGGSGLIAKHYAIDVRFSNIHSDGYIQRATTDLTSYFVQGSYLNDNTTIKFITFGGKERTYFAWDGVPKDSLSTNRTYNPSGHMAEDANGNPIGKNFYPNATDNYVQTNYQLHLTHSLSNEWKLNGALHYTKGIGYYEEYKVGQSYANYGLNPIINGNDTITSSNLIRRKWLNNDFYGAVAAVKYDSKKLSFVMGGGINQYLGQHYGNVIGLDSLKNLAPIKMNQEYYHSIGNKLDANVYSKVNYSIVDNLIAYADLQYRHIDYLIDGSNGETASSGLETVNFHPIFDFFNPKAGLTWKINDNHKFYSSIAVANREPNRSCYTTSNALPKSENLTDVEVGYELDLAFLKLGINGYYMYYNNQLVQNGQINAVGEYVVVNVPESYREGVELSSQAKITNWLSWGGNLALSQSKIKEFTEILNQYDANWNNVGLTQNVYHDTPISFSPNLTATTNLLLHFDRLDINWQLVYVGSQYIDNTGSADRSLSAYCVNNLRVGYTFPIGKTTLAVNLLANNILNALYSSNAWVSSYEAPSKDDPKVNQRYDMMGMYPQAPINFMGNIIFKF
jgi:iron complex outermembrane recepter protein